VSMRKQLGQLSRTKLVLSKYEQAERRSSQEQLAGPHGALSVLRVVLDPYPCVYFRLSVRLSSDFRYFYFSKRSSWLYMAVSSYKRGAGNLCISVAFESVKVENRDPLFLTISCFNTPNIKNNKNLDSIMNCDIGVKAT